MKKWFQFKWIYLIYLGILAVLVLAATLYVRSLLADYEAKQPERQVEAILVQLAEEAASPDTFWTTYGLPDVQGGAYELNKDIKKEYLSLYAEGTVDYTPKTGSYAEDERCYLLQKGSYPLAEVLLKAVGPQETKLAVFSMREWTVASVKPLLELREYTVAVPKDFSVSANGIALSDGQADGDEIKYTLSGVWLEPKFTIADASGAKASYMVKNFRVLPELYDYTLTLPSTLTVTVNGAVSAGTVHNGGLMRNDIMLLQKPQVTIADLYGNTVSYEGGEQLPLTNMTILAPADYTVKVGEQNIPDSAVIKGVSADYEILTGLVQDLPQQAEYQITVLKENATVTVTDSAGNPVPLAAGETRYDLTKAPAALDAVPAEVASSVDVLQIAEQWSLFMSNDVSFEKMAQLMVPDSYQYNVAKSYSTSVDRLFFASHSLLAPAFTDTGVSNFVWITEDSFSVDIRFVKHMRLTNGGKQVDDAMNDRFYFVKNDGKWMLAGMKEVADDAE